MPEDANGRAVWKEIVLYVSSTYGDNYLKCVRAFITIVHTFLGDLSD